MKDALTNPSPRTFVEVPGFGRCEFVRRWPSTGGRSPVIEVLTPGGTKIPVAERLTKPVSEEAGR